MFVVTDSGLPAGSVFLRVVKCQARSQGGGGGGGEGGARMSASRTDSRALEVRERMEVRGYPPPVNLEKKGYLGLHFVRFENSIIGNKAGKSEGH